MHRYMMKLADRFPLTDLPRANSLRGTLVLSKELPARPPRLDNLAPSSLPDVLGRQGYAPGRNSEVTDDRCAVRGGAEAHQRYRLPGTGARARTTQLKRRLEHPRGFGTTRTLAGGVSINLFRLGCYQTVDKNTISKSNPLDLLTFFLQMS